MSTKFTMDKATSVDGLYASPAFATWLNNKDAMQAGVSTAANLVNAQRQRSDSLGRN